MVGAADPAQERQADASRATEGAGRTLEVPTRPATATGGAEDLLVTALTVLWHSDPRRVGDRAWLPGLDEGEGVALSRLEPLFAPPAAERPPAPLGEARLSRRPLRLLPRPGGLSIEREAGLPPLEVDGQPLEGSRAVSDGELARGVVLLLGGRVALLLHRRTPEEVHRTPARGLVGESAGLARLRRQIAQVADLDHPVLLRGATGTGKELVARAIQAASRRRNGPFLALNLAAVPPTLAASELFGAARGAFTGADRGREGAFIRADGGTLLLDEIGEAPREIQGALLRVLEDGEVQAVGSERARRVDVRVITATDADLEACVADGRFAGPLLQRLGGVEIRLPPLAERREDLGRLVLHFLRSELAAVGEEERLTSPTLHDRPYVPARLVARLALHDWPGNVRELRNALRRLVVASRGADRLDTGTWLAAAVPALGAEAPPAAGAPPAARRPARVAYRDPSDVGSEELVAALGAHDWNLAATAAALGLSRPSLYALLDRHAAVRKASALTAEEIAATLDRCGGSIEAAARHLRVSKHALKRQIRRPRVP